MTEEVYGYIECPNEIDITDPCYDEDVWCRINRFPIPAGEYECYALTADNDETEGCGERIARCGIRKPGSKTTYYERKGMIGVDSGMAGFFNCDNQKVFEEEILNDHASVRDVYIGDNYFVTSSGYGDGGYDIWAGYYKGELVEVYIEFM